MAERIGIIGLGRMGAALAARAAAEGFATTGWTRSGGDAVAAKAAGYALAPRLEDATAASDILLLSLFDGPAVDEVLTRLAALPLVGKLVVETSTVSPAIVRRHDTAIRRARGALIDAPISGGPEMVTDGTIGLFVGGTDPDVERFLAIAPRFSNRFARIGALGDGVAAKIVNNVALAGAFCAAIEAMELGRAMGLDQPTMLDFLEKSPGTSPAFKTRVQKIAGHDDSVGFPVDGAVKDARVFIGAAEAAGVDIPIYRDAARRFRLAQADGQGARDVAAAARLAPDVGE